jgi:hypothetical protein
MIVFLALLPCRLQAQHNATMYFMYNLPAANQLNPALIPEEGNIYVGIPLLSSTYIDGGLTPSGMNLSSIMSNMFFMPGSTSNFESTYFNAELNLLNFGLLLDGFYFTLDATLKSHGDVSIPNNLITLNNEGNAPTQGKPISLHGLGMYFDSYASVALGVATELVPRFFTVGLKVKRLFGITMMDIHLGPNSYLYTDPNTWAVTAGFAPNINVSGIPVTAPLGSEFLLDSLRLNTSDYSPSISGAGWGLDIGFKFETGDFSAYGSLTNLGWIGWDNSTNIKAATEHFEFGRINLNSSADILTSIKDTLLMSSKLSSTKQDYSHWIEPTISFGLTYQFNPNFYAGALTAITVGEYSNYPMFALSLNTRKYFVNGSLSYSIGRNSYNNIGMGVIVGRHALQMHVICDNVLAADLQGARKTNLRVGFNLLLGERYPSIKKKLNELNTATQKDAGMIITKKPLNPPRGALSTPIEKRPLSTPGPTD